MIHRLQDVRDEHLVRGTVGDDVAVLQDDDAVAVAGGEVQVVEHDSGTGKPADQFEDVVLVADVEVVRRLVEKDVGGLLGERPGDEGALMFTTGETVQVAPREVGESDGVECAGDDGPVVAGGARPEPLVGQSSERHQVGDAHRHAGGRGVTFLGDDGDAGGDVASPCRGEVVAVEQDAPGCQRCRTVEGTQHCGLPRTVGADEAERAGGGHGEGDTVDDGASGVGDLDVLGRDHGCSRRYSFSVSTPLRARGVGGSA